MEMTQLSDLFLLVHHGGGVLTPRFSAAESIVGLQLTGVKRVSSAGSLTGVDILGHI